MRFSIEAKLLYNALAKAQKINSNVRIRTSGQGIIINSENSGVMFQGGYGAEVDLRGAIDIQSKKLYEIIRNRPGKVGINKIENQIVVEIGRARYCLEASDCYDFNDYSIGDGPFAKINSALLKPAVKVSASITAPKDRHEFGVLFEKIDNALRIVSTDSISLYYSDIPVEGDFKFPGKSAIFHKHNLKKINQFLGTKGHVFIDIKGIELAIIQGNEALIIKFFDGGFPDYSKAINIDGTTSITVNRDDLLSITKRMESISLDDSGGVRFYLTAGELVIALSDSEERIVVAYAGPDVEIWLNPKRLIDALKALKDDRIIMNIKNKKSPCILKSTDGNSVCAFMPLGGTNV